MASDLLLGLYFLIILVHDYKYYGNYVRFDIQWRKSITCQTIGILASISRLLSNFLLFLLTFEKFLGINSLRIKRQENFKKIIFSLSFIILLSILLSVLPLFIHKVSRREKEMII